MDAERQPLLGCSSDVRCRRLRPLSPEEVHTATQELTWRRTRFFLVLMFWAILAMLLSVITCVLANASSCYDTATMSSVPPVHISFAPLISKINREVYAM